jgi:hypothetical protein
VIVLWTNFLSWITQCVGDMPKHSEDDLVCIVKGLFIIRY